MDLFSIGFVVCTLSGIACFWLFFKCIDWFEKIQKKKGETSYVHSIICS